MYLGAREEVLRVFARNIMPKIDKGYNVTFGCSSCSSRNICRTTKWGRYCEREFSSGIIDVSAASARYTRRLGRRCPLREHAVQPIVLGRTRLHLICVMNRPSLALDTQKLISIDNTLVVELHLSILLSLTIGDVLSPRLASLF